MRWIFALIIIFSLWIYGFWLFLTDGRTKPASFNNFIHRMGKIGKRGWSEIRDGSKSAYKDTRDKLNKTFGTPTMSREEMREAEKEAIAKRLKELEKEAGL